MTPWALADLAGSKVCVNSLAGSRLTCELAWAVAEGGGKTYRVDLGGENVLQSVLSKSTFGGLRNWGWSGRCLFLLREMTESRQKRGGENVS